MNYTFELASHFLMIIVHNFLYGLCAFQFGLIIIIIMIVVIINIITTVEFTLAI